jgi:hypothetical protein
VFLRNPITGIADCCTRAAIIAALVFCLLNIPIPAEDCVASVYAARAGKLFDDAAAHSIVRTLCARIAPNSRAMR